MMNACKINPFAGEGRETSKISMSDLTTEPGEKRGTFDLEHLDNACKACPPGTTGLVIQSGTRKAIAAATGAGALVGIPLFVVGAIPVSIVAAVTTMNAARSSKNVMPGCYAGLSGIETVKASSLSLVDVDSLLGIESLKKLDLYGNNLDKIPDISRLPNLNELNLRKNLIPAFTCDDIRVGHPNAKFKGKNLEFLRDCLSRGKVVYGVPEKVDDADYFDDDEAFPEEE
jgi:Leucine-rich repeat (LRR) protein